MKNSILLRKSLMGIFLLVVIVLLICVAGEKAHAAKYLTMETKRPKSQPYTTIKCKWKKLNGARYYKLEGYYEDKGKIRDRRKVKLNSKKRSYTFKKLKKNEEYEFWIRAYNKKGKKIDESHRYDYTGIAPAVFDFEYAQQRGDCISFEFLVSLKWVDYKVICVDLQRRVENGKWKKIKTFPRKKLRDDYNGYADYNVKFGRTYEYRLRTKAKTKIGRRMVNMYSMYDYAKVTAVNDQPISVCEYSEDTPATDSMTQVEIINHMDKYNPDCTINFGKKGKTATVNDAGDDYLGDMKVQDYKLDDGEWQSATGKLELKPGQKLAFRLASVDGKALDFSEIGDVYFQVSKDRYFYMNMSGGEGKIRYGIDSGCSLDD